MEVETVRLSRIVTKLLPELYGFLTPEELETCVVLRDGIDILEMNDAVEIVRQSIYKHQQGSLIH